ncbi:hypothetical protein WMY93_011520 [Mugilogobius chulae]|uniref:Uncharacterized protein n=1 Tax=Mugilogobius chulae TaxID=88201 RepID=A0AAW0PBR5_9GOBI
MSDDSVNKYLEERNRLLLFFSVLDNPLKDIYDDSVYEIKNAKEELRILNERLDQYIKRVATLEDQKKQLEQDVEEQKNTVSNELADKQQQNIELSLKYNMLQANSSKISIKVEKADEQIKEYKEEIKDAEAKIKKLDESKELLKQSTDLSRKVIENLSTTQQMTVEKTEEYKDKLNKAKKENKRVKNECNQKSEEWTRVRKEMRSLQKTLQEMEETHTTEISEKLKLEKEKVRIKMDMDKKLFAFMNLRGQKLDVEDEIDEYGDCGWGSVSAIRAADSGPPKER